jgi:hypothetical protein
MMLDWNAYPAELGARVKEMSRLAPNAAAGFMALDNGADKTTQDPRTPRPRHRRHHTLRRLHRRAH